MYRIPALLFLATTLHAAAFQANLSFSLAIPLNTADYTVNYSNGSQGELAFSSQFGNAAAVATDPTSDVDQDTEFIGVIPVNLLLTAGPVVGFANPYGHSDAVSLITSASFTIENLTKNGIDLNLNFNFNSFAQAQKVSNEDDEYANARVNFKFADLLTGDQFQFVIPGQAPEEEFQSEVRLDPEDPANTLTEVCNCTGTVNVHLDANQTIQFAVLASAQGNATWIPEPSSALFAIGGLALVGAARRIRRRAA
jgi:hypothetical protein